MIAFQATLHQMIVFFLVLAIGFVAGKARVIEEDYLPKYAKLITTVFLPVMTVVPMIASQRGKEGDYAAGITIATLVVSVATIPFVQFLLAV